MRQDMPEILQERRRHRASTEGKTLRRREQRDQRCDSLPSKQSMAGPYSGWIKMQSVANTSPLKRYLVSQVGRLWDEVAAELLQGRGNKTFAQNKLRKHLHDLVALHVEIVDGQPQSRAKSTWRRGLAQAVVWVHPDTGIVMPVPRKPRRKRKEKLAQVYITWDQRFVWLDEQWKLVVLKPLPPEVPLHNPALPGDSPGSDQEAPPEFVQDAVLGKLHLTGKKQPGRARAEIFWGSCCYAIVARGLGRKEERLLLKLLQVPAARRPERSACVRPH